jgi:hypothetical protein
MVDPSAGPVITGAVGAVVSTVNVTGAEAGLGLPAGSVCVAVTVCDPSANGVLGVQDHEPSACTVAVQSGVPPSVTVTVAPGSPVPVTVGVLSLVLEPFTGAVITGAAGAVVSTVNVTGAEAGLGLPAGSVCVAVIVCEPSANGAVGVQVHEPSACTVAVQTLVPPSVTVTVLPGSPVPVTGGVGLLMVDPSAGPVITGAVGAVVSTVNLSGAEAGLTLPAASVWVAVTVCEPSLNGVAGRHDHEPSAATVAVHTVVPPSTTVTVWPGIPVPAIVGVLSLVLDPLVGAVITGAPGTAVMIVKVSGAETGEVLPARSVCVAVIVWEPSLNGVLGVQDHEPSAATVAVHTVVPPSTTVTVAPGSPVPLMVGVLSFVAEPPAGPVITGAAGADVSTVNVSDADAGEVFPAASCCVAVIVCEPSANGVDGTQLQLPPLVTTAVHRVLPPSTTVTVAPASPEPVIVGVLSFVVEPLAGAVMAGADGAVVSTVNVTGADAGDVLPAGSVCVAVIVCEPSLNGADGTQLQPPPAATTAVHRVAAPSVTVTVSPTTPVPVIVGVLSLVLEPATGAVMTGAPGIAVITVNVTGADTGDVLPAGSVCVAVIVCAPSLNGADGVQDHEPSAATVAVHSVVPPSTTVTVAPGSPVPLMVGVLSFVAEPPAGPVITGAAGADVSTVNVTGAEAGDGLPAGSTCVAVIVCEPSANGVDGTQLQLPPLVTTAVHRVVPPSKTVTVAPGSPEPAMVGVLSFVTEPDAGAVINGAVGAVVSTVNVSGADAGDVLPAASVAVAVIVCDPSLNAVAGEHE